MQARYAVIRRGGPLAATLVLGAGVAAVFAAEAPSAAAPGFAVVELFTSEGCSSCPGADEWLNDLVLEARAKGTAVYPLAFHVDYWNRLQTRQGVWVDPFSHRGCTLRQAFYLAPAEPGKKRNLVTPQVVVNGTPLRADRDRLGAAVAEALAVAAPSRLELKATIVDDALDVEFTRDPAAGMFLILAIVERGLTSVVTTGENAGRSFVHENVVRGFSASRPEQATGSIRLPIAPQVKPENASLIGFLQRADDRSMEAAAQVDLASLLPDRAAPDAAADASWRTAAGSEFFAAFVRRNAGHAVFRTANGLEKVVPITDLTPDCRDRLEALPSATAPMPTLSGTCADGQCIVPVP